MTTMTRSDFRHQHRLARLGNLGTLACSLPNQVYQWFLTQVYDLRFPHIGDDRHGLPRTFDRLAARNWRHGNLLKLNGRLSRARASQ